LFSTVKVSEKSQKNECGTLLGFGFRRLAGEERQQGRDGTIISGYFFGVKTVATVLARFALDSPRFKPWAVEKTVLGMVLAI
jgi:hypothetical protein